MICTLAHKKRKNEVDEYMTSIPIQFELDNDFRISTLTLYITQLATTLMRLPTLPLDHILELRDMTGDSAYRSS
jgi:hypothetical protein